MVSEMTGFPLSPSVMHSVTPVLMSGQKLMHSLLHFLFWHLSCSTAAILMHVPICASFIMFRVS